ncbi:serine/threonine protein kinase [Bacillus solitudinis]|uniref:serine/threonine protein kinase n=1 Tax=Bacillus solitudinis TaxID=2014074 RepID=UPI000C23D978|nr:serine/threonine protein kinase [Bacillus solitudinis]
MEKKWNVAIDSLSRISVFSSPNNEPVTISGTSDDLKCIGVGTDAAVFQSLSVPEYAFKLYAEDKASKVKVEESIYHLLGQSPFFPTCFDAYDRCLVLSYEEGATFFDCLLQGIHIPKQAIKDVEDARKYVCEKGLNPRDIHLKNILLQNGRAKIIDVSEYIQPGNDYRWEHLKKAYDEYYHLIDGKSIPFWVLETVRKWYNQWNKYFSSYEEFTKFILKLFTFKK